MGRDFYKILGVPHDATDQQLKKAYRTLAIKWHPDKHPDPNDKKKAEEMFKDIAEAYQVLSDKEQRMIYDKYGEAGLQGAAAEGTMNGGTHTFVYRGVDPSELFSRFFNADHSSFFSSAFDDEMPGFGMGSRKTFVTSQQPMKPTAQEIPLKVTLEELYQGCQKKLKVTTKKFNAMGETKEERILEIRVKPGWKDGTKITFAQQGDQPAAHMPPADIVFVVTSKPHPQFVRNGNHLIVKYPITVGQAISGFVAEVNTLDKRTLKIRIDDIVNPKTRKIVQGEGMPISKKPGEKGDLILEFDITFPKYLPPDKRRKIAELLP